VSLASLDIECESWDKFAVGALRHADGSHTLTWDEDELVDEVLAHEGDLWTWAGGRYDAVWFARCLAKRGIRATGRLGGGGLVSLKAGKCTIRDGFRLFPVGLSKAAPLAKMQKAKTELPCVCGKVCGGYCSIRARGMSSHHRRMLESYLVHDVDCAAATVETIASRFEEWGLVFKNTIGSSAWATMRDLYGVPKQGFREWRDWEAAARGYHGGRTEMYRRSAPLIWRYDLHAAYPAALAKTEVPVGDYERHVTAQAARDFERRRPGIYACTVTVPKMHVPPLPTHADDRLLYCTGTFEGSWPLPELEAALELGVTIQHFDESIVWDRAERVCEPYMRHVWGLRARYLAQDPKAPEALLLKFAANAPTGKLGQNPESECLELNPDPDDVMSCGRPELPFEPCFGGAMHGSMQGCCQHQCRDRCKSWEPLDLDGEAASWPPLVWSRPVWQLSDCSHVQMAAYLTGVTRVELGAEWRHAGPALCYGDTDSTYATRKLSRRVGEGLGEHGFDGWGLDYLARGPKALRFANAYAEQHPGEGDWVVSGEYEVRSKGVPIEDALVWDRWAGWNGRALADEGEPVPLEGGVWGIKGGSRRGDIFIRRDMSRAAKNSLEFAGSRRVHADGTTSPLDFDEYTALVLAGEL
jgi:hypothetical protein